MRGHSTSDPATVTLTLACRWLAVEALTDNIFSPASEVWALGVTLWEMFTLGTLVIINALMTPK